MAHPPDVFLSARSHHSTAEQEREQQMVLQNSRQIHLKNWAITASGMTESTRTLSSRNIENDLVVFGWRNSSRHIVKPQSISNAPRDIVICA